MGIDKYIAKPVVIEAFQIGVEKLPKWFKEALLDLNTSQRFSYYEFDQKGNCKVIIWETFKPDNQMIATKGDMVLRFPLTGELYTMKKETFDSMYQTYGGINNDIL